jgi:small multidrug resistance family-3 protein
MLEIKTILLFLLTAVAEIVGCYLPYLWLTQGKSAWLLIPAGLSLAVFAWLLSLHPTTQPRQAVPMPPMVAFISSWPFFGSGRLTA